MHYEIDSTNYERIASHRERLPQCPNSWWLRPSLDEPREAWYARQHARARDLAKTTDTPMPGGGVWKA